MTGPTSDDRQGAMPGVYTDRMSIGIPWLGAGESVVAVAVRADTEAADEQAQQIEKLLAEHGYRVITSGVFPPPDQ